METHLVIAVEALVHDIIEVHQELPVGQHVLVFGHHFTDESVGLQFPLLEL